MCADEVKSGETLSRERFAELEAEARLQVRVGRALLRQKLHSCGTALLWAWLLAMALLAIWWTAWSLLPGTGLGGWVVGMLHVSPMFLTKLVVLAMTAWKLTAFMFFLIPGLALRIVAASLGVA